MKRIKYLLYRFKRDKKSAFFAQLFKWFLIYYYGYLRNIKAKEFYALNSDSIKCKVNDYYMYLSTEGKGICKDLYLDGYREPLSYKAWFEKINGSNLVIDIGANIGYYAIPESKVSKIVYAIEPVKRNYDLLKKNLELNGTKNVITYNKAIGEFNGVTQINVANNYNLSSLLENAPMLHSKIIRKDNIEVCTLDSLVDGVYPDAVRMDVEGYEYNILLGMKHILEQNKPLKIFIELHFNLLGDNTIPFLNLLKEHGFKLAFSSLEQVISIRGHKIGEYLLRKSEKIIGLENGVANLTIDDLYDKRFTCGQVSNLMGIFER